MGLAIEGAFQRVRGAIFARSTVLQALVAEHGWTFTKLQVVQAAHAEKAWQALRGRLEPEQVAAARARGERWALTFGEHVALLRRIGALERLPRVVVNEGDAITYLFELFGGLLHLPPLRGLSSRLSPRSRLADLDGLFAGWEEERGLKLPAELLAELMGILGDLTAEFLKQLEEVGKFELPPVLPAPVRVDLRIRGAPDVGAGIAGFGVGDLEILETGDLFILTASPGAGAAVTVVSPALHGPSVIERLFFAQSAGGTSDFQLMIQPGGVSYPAAAGPVGIFGDSLFASVADAGVAGSRVQMAAFTRTAEWWPRRFVPYSGYRLVLTVNNTGDAAISTAMSVDRRDVIRRIR